MTSSDERLYQALTEATDALAGPGEGEHPSDRLDELLRAPDTRRCWREVVTGEDPLTLDGIAACFGSENLSDTGRAIAASDDELLAQLTASQGGPARTHDPDRAGGSRVSSYGPPPDQPTSGVLVPEDELFEAFARELGREAASGVEMAGTRSSLPDAVTGRRRHQAVA